MNRLEREASAPHDRAWLEPVAVVAAAALFCWPLVRYVGWLGDEGILLNGARRILRGQDIYRDFFEILPPGGFLMTAAWLRVGGDTFLAARLLAIATLSLTAGFAYAANLRLTNRRALAAGLVLAWLLCSALSIEVAHHWLTTMLSMAALAGMLRLLAHERPSRLLACAVGIAAGAAAMVTEQRGAATVLAAMAGLLLARRWREILPYLAGVALPAIAGAGWLAWSGLLGDAVAEVLSFPLNHYSSIQWVRYGANAGLQNWPLVTVFPLALALGVAVLVRNHGRRRRDPGVTVSFFFAAASLITCYPRPNVFHLDYAAPLALPLLAAGLAWMGDRVGPRLPLRSLAGLCLLVMLAGPAVVYANMVRYARSGPRLSVAGNRFVPGEPTSPRDLVPIVERIAARPAEERVFFYPYDPLLSFLLGREQVAANDLFTPGYTTPRQYQQACQAAVARADWLIFDRQWADPRFLKLAWPAMLDAAPAETRAVEAALRDAFEPVIVNERYELRRKKPTAISAGCDRIDRYR